ncbi:MAG TPA: MBL fold metallo-hydrolase [Gemmataceae bacterium]|nr:MBL fold metallo-hydrolase [Gemmataceae bacterium]
MNSTTLAQRIVAARPAAGSIAVWWLGGSGFIFKTSSGQQVWIDPYLSDVVHTIFGVGRAFPPPIQIADAAPDIVIATHWHEDHLDPGSIPELARRRPEAKFVMPPSAMARALSWGLPRTQIIPISRGQTVDLAGALLTAIIARHEVSTAGWEVPDALGVVLDFDGVRVFHTGDTEYDARIHRAVASTNLALATLCINGSGGNMSAYEAALLAWHLDAATFIPHHHQLWAKAPEPGETLDPRIFEETYRRLGGTASVHLPVVGGGWTITSKGVQGASLL